MRISREEEVCSGTNLRSCLFPALLLFLFLSACTANISIPVLQPAAITVPANVKKLVLVNRYKPEKENKAFNIIEGILTGEGIGQDKRAAEFSLESLMRNLSNSPRFTPSRSAEELKGSGTGILPPVLEAETVKALCARNQADGLVTIEAFDSDTKFAYGQYMKSSRNKLNQEIKIPVTTVTATISVTTGWRMYDGRTGQLLDEYRMAPPVTFNAEGPTQPGAIANLPSRENILRKIGDQMGAAYAFRISPTWIRVNRFWYKKAKRNPDMKTACDYMLKNEFEEARNYYLEASRDPNPKVAAKAFYNLAIVCEALGDLEQGIQYCDLAIKKGNKDAYSYRRILKDRLSQREVVKEQMGE